MTISHAQSQQWEHINNTRLTEDAVADLRDFKSGDINFKLALWDPRVNGVRYLKALTYTLATGLSERHRAQLRRVRNRDVGSPITVIHDGESVCLDYIRAAYELSFISDHVPLDGATVLEIGAGYGRTCHTIVSNHDVAAYVILDLPNTLAVSSKYLAAVLSDEQLARVRFVPVDRLDAVVSPMTFDLCLNIDSFAEMPPDTVRSYLSLVDGRCGHLYVNNPVGKYVDPSLDGHAEGADVVAMAMETGLLRDVVDIHDNRAVADEADRFVDAYRPGSGWSCVANDWAPPWSFYWQALYRRQTPAGAAPSNGAARPVGS